MKKSYRRILRERKQAVGRARSSRAPDGDVVKPSLTSSQLAARAGLRRLASLALIFAVMVLLFMLCAGCMTLPAERYGNPPTYRADTRAEAVAKAKELYPLSFPLVPAATGSMWPTLDEGCALAWIYKPFSDLRRGDIIVGTVVLHRIVGGNASDGFQTEGDANVWPDREPLTEKNYTGVVAAIVRFRDVPYHRPISLAALQASQP